MILRETPLGSEVPAIEGPGPGSWTANRDAGYFVGRVRTDWVGARRVRLVEDFLFVGPDGYHWHARAGDVCDGSSIPWLLQRYMGSPFVGLHRFASVIHDRACIERIRPSAHVHHMYLNACLAAGEPKAWWLGQGVIYGGPRFRGIRA